MAAVISSTSMSMSNLLHSCCYPSISIFNNNKKKAIPTSSRSSTIARISCLNKITSTTTTTLNISNNNKEKSNNTFIVSPSSSSSSSSISSPWLMLPSREAKNKDDAHTLYGRCFYDIVEKTFVPAFREQQQQHNSTTSSSHDHLINPREYLSDGVKCIGASHGWLAFINRRDCSLFLCNPLTTQTIELPPIQTLSAFPSGACYRKLDDGSFEIAGFIFKDYQRSDGDDDEGIWTFKELIRYERLRIILTSSPLEKDCVVVISASRNLDFCKIGDDKWTNLQSPILQDGATRGYWGDVVYRTKDNKIYTEHIPDVSMDLLIHPPDPNPAELKKESSVADFTRLAIWDLSDASCPQYTSKKFCQQQVLEMDEWLDRKMMTVTYLVESPPSGKLLNVFRFIRKNAFKYPYKTEKFEVFEFDEESNKLVEVRDLGDMALFVGINHSLAVNAQELPGLFPNAIYYGDVNGDLLIENFSFCGYQIPSFIGHDFGVYSLRYQSMISPCYSTRSKHFLPPPLWILP